MIDQRFGSLGTGSVRVRLDDYGRCEIRARGERPALISRTDVIVSQHGLFKRKDRIIQILHEKVSIAEVNCSSGALARAHAAATYIRHLRRSWREVMRRQLRGRGRRYRALAYTPTQGARVTGPAEEAGPAAEEPGSRCWLGAIGSGVAPSAFYRGAATAESSYQEVHEAQASQLRFLQAAEGWLVEPLKAARVDASAGVRARLQVGSPWRAPDPVVTGGGDTRRGEIEDA